MIRTVEITIERNGRKEVAQLDCDNENVTIKFTMQNGFCKTYSDSDFYRCFARIREDNSDINFLCKGAKVNVHPSSMSSQMSLGLKAYELTLGQTPDLSDVVYIFDYEENNLTNDPKEQQTYFRKWIETEKH
ncbi:hypothetical protein HNR03_000672 [Pseudomonas sp. JAI111]|uniref:hypothetical protein n=1 Tax=Pseudomonas sp. JAI111 TaxID=2735913 RepID=UPI0021671473|nr:hypothetical protein [Pseudomonas sp. JAI111]MCS3836092.1 hypothetical protein [Pseudomonas sp. JAI111]